MSEWKELTLKEAGIILIDCDHKTPLPTDRGLPYIAIPQLKDGYINFSDARLISEEDFKIWTRKANPQTHDIVLSRRCNPGESAYVADGMKFALGQNLVLLRSEGKLVIKPFLRWLIKSPAWWSEVSKFINVGAVFNSLKCGEIINFTLPIPPIQEQEHISKTLSCLGNKIDNLRRQNETLEEIARSIFKHWFIDFEFPNPDGKPYKSSGGVMVRSDLGDIPEGWRVGKLGDVALFNNGKSSPERSDDFNIPIYGSNGVIGKASKSNYQNIVIIGRVGSYCGSLYYFLDKCWVTDNAMIGRLINKTSHAFLYFVLQTIKLNRLSTGSGQPLLNQSILSSIEWALPTNICIENFENAVKSIFEKMLLNNNQIQTLTKTRDALLPKLMSGQLRVNE